MELPLPCPLKASWELVRTIELPRALDDGQKTGGFSAAAYQAKQDRLWLLSDASIGHLVPWDGLAKMLEGKQESLRPGRRVMLRGSDGVRLSADFDGEGLVIEGSQAWISSEGRRSAERRAKIIRIDLVTGKQKDELTLPLSWQTGPGKGIGSNQGPESLTTLGPGDLILATETPLLQNGPNGGISLARRRPGEKLRSAGTLDPGIMERYEGLTELQGLPQSQQLLGLRRSYKPLNRWSAELQLFGIPELQSPPLKPIIGWNLLKIGLPADNWEAMTVGPQLSDGRQTLILGSDNNFNPLQTSWIAVLTARRTGACKN